MKKKKLKQRIRDQQFLINNIIDCQANRRTIEYERGFKVGEQLGYLEAMNEQLVYLS